MAAPLLVLKGLSRAFPAGDGTITVLKNVDLRIDAGEMIAIIGASGSGKSTLMNILGCLDRPSTGSYEVNGVSTALLDPDALAQLRREYFGFIFQRYHLLNDLTALQNVEIPAIYAGASPAQRHERAETLLRRLGLGDRMQHRPGQLSGGQQQRVSIARALMNGGEIILADEPTGALDRHSGQELISLLKELHAEGHTIIIVTHDPQVARHADRVIEISDGEILSDTRNAPGTPTPPRRQETHPAQASPAAFLRADWDRFAEAFRMALRSMAAHRLRTFLTMLGIVIGIASVVSVVALGQGSRQQILSDISAMGTNTIDIFPGKDFGDEKAQTIHTLSPSDAAVLSRQSYVDSVTPSVSTSAVLRYGNVTANAAVSGVGEQYFRVRGMEIAEGRAFSAGDAERHAQEGVIDHNTRKRLFRTDVDPIGQVVFLGSIPIRIIGVAKEKQGPFGGNENLSVWVPYTTAMSRITGQAYLKSITVRVHDAVPAGAAEANINKLLKLRHSVKDFYLSNSDSIRQTIEKTTATMTLLVSAIALISLVVGGIGVMNIMLVSVTERTREIGVRMAVGARRNDIMRQFLIEAVLVCLVGGLLGIAIAFALGMAVAFAGSGFRMIYSTASIVAAFGCSTLIGVVFGFLPARDAARLDPVDALARE